MKGRKARILKEFSHGESYGELEFIPYQTAFGFSIRNLKCDGMGQLFRFYFGPFKLWLNIRKDGIGMKS